MSRTNNENNSTPSAAPAAASSATSATTKSLPLGSTAAGGGGLSKRSNLNTAAGASSPNDTSSSSPQPQKPSMSSVLSAARRAAFGSGGGSAREPFAAAGGRGGGNPTTVLKKEGDGLTRVLEAAKRQADANASKLHVTSASSSSNNRATGGGGGGGGSPGVSTAQSPGDGGDGGNSKRNNRDGRSPPQSNSKATTDRKTKPHHAAGAPPDEELSEPTFCSKMLLCFDDVISGCRHQWRRLMSLPVAFIIWHYFLPFVLELTILILHFQELSNLPGEIPFRDWSNFPRLENFVIVDAVFGTLLAIRFLIGMVTARMSLLRFLLSAYGLVSLLTVPMMMYPAFHMLANPDHTYAESDSILKKGNYSLAPSTIDMIDDRQLFFSVPSVAAWRIWIVYDIVQTIIFASTNVSKSFRAIVFQLSFILTLFFTCMATMQLIFCVESGAYVDLGTSFYFSAVTLTTVGYGDFYPKSVLGRAFIITQIFAAMLAVPLLLAETDRLLRFLLSLTGYAGSDRHIIVFGELTETEFDLLVNERFHGDGRDDPLHIVFVASKFSQEIQDRVTDSNISNQVTLCIANQLSRSELIRFSPHRADAALFYSPSTTAAMRGDYRIIAAASAVRLHHPSLPQYLMMRRTDAAHLVEGAFVVFDRDFLRAALLGTALQIPGFLPMFLNLVRLVPDKVVGSSSSSKDSDDYSSRDDEEDGSGSLSSSSNNNTTLGNSTDGGGDSSKSKHHQQPTRSGGGGGGPASPTVASSSSSSPFSPPPKKEPKKKSKPTSWYDMYLSGAKQNIYTIAVPDVLVGRTFVVASFIVQLRTGSIPIGLVRDSRVALNAGNTPIHSSDSLVVIARSWEELNAKFSKFPTTSSAQETLHTNVTKIALRSKEVHFDTENRSTTHSLFLASRHNNFPFQKHVILVDLASFVTAPEMCAEERYQMEQFQVQDMLALASRFPKWQSFVLLSLSKVTETLQVEWAKSGRQPMFHVRKSPLDNDALRLCRIGSCMSVLIFSSLSSTNANDDTFRSAMFTVNRRIQAALRSESAVRPPGWQHPNVISVLDSPDEALLLAPEHKSLRGEVLEHDAHCTAFATGGGLCPTLLDGLMFRTYYNEYLPQVVELLLEPNSIHRERAGMLCPALYEDLEDALLDQQQQQKDDDQDLFVVNGLNGAGADNNNEQQQQQIRYPTFGQVCRVMTAAKIICFGFSRGITSAERGIDTVGKVFFMTNPDLSTPVLPDDYVFYLSQWTPDRLARDFFA